MIICYHWAKKSFDPPTTDSEEREKLKEAVRA